MNNNININIDTPEQESEYLTEQNLDGGFNPLDVITSLRDKLVGLPDDVQQQALRAIQLAQTHMPQDVFGKYRLDILNFLISGSMLSDITGKLPSIPIGDMVDFESTFNKFFEGTALLEPIKYLINFIYTLVEGQIDKIALFNPKTGDIFKNGPFADMINKFLEMIFPDVAQQGSTQNAWDRFAAKFEGPNLISGISTVLFTILREITKASKNIRASYDLLPVPIRNIINSVSGIQTGGGETLIPTVDGRKLKAKDLIDPSNFNYVDLDKINEKYKQLPKESQIFGDELDFENIEQYKEQAFSLYKKLHPMDRILGENPEETIINQMGGESVIAICVVIAIVVVVVVVVLFYAFIVLVVAVLIILVLVIAAVVLLVMSTVGVIAILAVISIVVLAVYYYLYLQEQKKNNEAYRKMLERTSQSTIDNNFGNVLNQFGQQQTNQQEFTTKMAGINTQIYSTAVDASKDVGTEGVKVVYHTGSNGMGAVTNGYGSFSSSASQVAVAGVGSVGSVGSVGTVGEVLEGGAVPSIIVTPQDIVSGKYPKFQVGDVALITRLEDILPIIGMTDPSIVMSVPTTIKTMLSGRSHSEYDIWGSNSPFSSLFTFIIGILAIPYDTQFVEGLKSGYLALPSLSQTIENVGRVVNTSQTGGNKKQKRYKLIK